MPIVKTTDVRGNGVRRILYGHIHELHTGEKVYVARRKRREIFRNGRGTISAAMTEEVAAWAIDEMLLFNLRAKQVEFLGVREQDTGDLYMTRLRVFFDRKCFQLKDYTGVGRGGSRQRYVPLRHFTCRKGLVALSSSLYE